MNRPPHPDPPALGAWVAAVVGGWAGAAAVASAWAGRPVAAVWSRSIPPLLLRGAVLVGAAAGLFVTTVPDLVAGRRWRRGPAGWAARRDLRPLAVARPGAGRLTIGYARRGRATLLAAERRASVVVLGPSQSGKTRGLAIPAVVEWDGPVVATSVKTDLVRDTIAARTTRGPTWVYDPTGSTGLPTTTWSPLAACTTWQGARRTAAWLCAGARTTIGGGDEDFWYAAATKLLAPYLFAAANAGRDVSRLVQWIDAQEEDEVASVLAPHPDALAAAWASWNRDERTRSSVFTTAEMVLEAFADPAVRRSAATSEVDPARLLGGGSATLYVCAPGHEQERLRPVFATLLHTVITAAYEAGELDPPLLIVLDEAANIAPLRDLDAIASTAAGHGIQLVTVWQDLAQLRARYGERASTVVNNHRGKNHLVGHLRSGDARLREPADR